MKDKCLNSSVLKCKDCADYQCKNLYGPIKEKSKCDKMIRQKEFDECMDENGLLKKCSDCEHHNLCSSLVRESVSLMV